MVRNLHRDGKPCEPTESIAYDENNYAKN